MRVFVSEVPQARREEVIRIILNSPIETSSAIIGENVGLHRETVRRIRIGEMWPDVLPQLPRSSPQQMRFRCSQCLHYVAERKREMIDGVDTRHKGRCGLGIPEACSVLFARGCGAFTPVEVSP